MRYAIAIILVAGSAYAAELPPHAHAIAGGWIECDRGFVMRANTCVSEAEQQANKVEVSSLPSAGEGALGSRSCPSGGCTALAPQATYSQPRRYHSGWHYDGEAAMGGATFVREVGGGRQVLIVPTWPR